MHLHRFQDEELKLQRNVDDAPGQVVEGLAILPFFPQWSEIKGQSLKKREFDVHLHSFQDEELKLHSSNVNDTPGQVVEGLTILPFPHRGQK